MSRRDLTPPYNLNTPADKPDLPALPDNAGHVYTMEALVPGARSQGHVMLNTGLAAGAKLFSEAQIRAYAARAADEREAWARADERRRAEPEIIAAFLERSGQWLTNDATHKAFEAETRRKALEKAATLIETTRETTTIENAGDTQRHLTPRKMAGDLTGMTWAAAIRALIDKAPT